MSQCLQSEAAESGYNFQLNRKGRHDWITHSMRSKAADGPVLNAGTAWLLLIAL